MSTFDIECHHGHQAREVPRGSLPTLPFPLPLPVLYYSFVPPLQPHSPGALPPGQRGREGAHV